MCVSDATKHVGFRLYKDKSSDFAVINILESLSSDTTVKDYIVAAILAYDQQSKTLQKPAELPNDISILLATIKDDTVKIFERLQNMSVCESNISSAETDTSQISTDADTSKELSGEALNVLDGLIF